MTSFRHRKRAKMLSVKLIRSIILGETINYSVILHHAHNVLRHYHRHQDELMKEAEEIMEETSYYRGGDFIIPNLIFIPTKEVVRDTSRVAAISREIGMDFYPDSTLSHLIFSCASSSSLPTLPVSLPFPDLSLASASQIRRFIRLSSGLFQAIFVKPTSTIFSDFNSSLSLFSRLNHKQVIDMDGFSRALINGGWSLFNTTYRRDTLYIFRKMESNYIRIEDSARIANVSDGSYKRIRELRLMPLDFKSGISHRVLQYILLMTDDLFYVS